MTFILCFSNFASSCDNFYLWLISFCFHPYFNWFCFVLWQVKVVTGRNKTFILRRPIITFTCVLVHCASSCEVFHLRFNLFCFVLWTDWALNLKQPTDVSLIMICVLASSSAFVQSVDVVPWHNLWELWHSAVVLDTCLIQGDGNSSQGRIVFSKCNTTFLDRDRFVFIIPLPSLVTLTILLIRLLCTGLPNLPLPKARS